MRFHLRIWSILVLTLITSFSTYAQGVKISPISGEPDPSAILDLGGIDRGVLLPRLTQVQRDLITTPAQGLMIYQTDVMPGLYVYSGSAWQLLASSTKVWSTSGNSGIDPQTQFIGTTDNVPLRFRVNNRRAGEINTNNFNLMLGDSAGTSLVSGIGNMGFGVEALRDNVQGYNNIAIGNAALRKTTVSNGLAIGNYALQNNTFGTANYAIGHGALASNTNGFSNLAIGEGALGFNVSGYGNTAIGQYAQNHNSGNANTAVGSEAMYTNTTGMNNTAIGSFALHNNTVSDLNTAVGTSALNNSIGEANTAIGSLVMYNTTSGHHNVAVGTSALYSNTTGEYNTGIGFGSMFYNTDGDYNAGLGANSGVFSGDRYNTVGIMNTNTLNEVNNKITIGNTSTTLIGGPVGWSVYSDGRIKTDVQEDVKGLDFIIRLRPVTYLRNTALQLQLTGNTALPEFPGCHDAETIRYSGFLAQEVESAANACGYVFSGVNKPGTTKSLYSLTYESFVVPLVKAVQEQQAIIQAQEKRIDDLAARLSILEQALITSQKNK
jgi:hypothetical protein